MLAAFTSELAAVSFKIPDEIASLHRLQKYDKSGIGFSGTGI